MALGSRRRRRLVALGFVLFVLSPCVWSQSDPNNVTPEDEYKKRIQINQDIQPLGENPFGEQIGLYNGSLSFEQTDVDVEGTGPSIQLMRSFHIPDTAVQPAFHVYHSNAFVDWDLDVPHIETLSAPERNVVNGIVSYTWYSIDDFYGTHRCSSFDTAPTMFVSVPGNVITYNPESWWHGFQLTIPGQGSQDLLARDASNAQSPQMTGPDGAAITFHLVTKQNWAIGCLPQTANGQPGEGFLAVSPGGMKYWLDYLIYKSTDAVSSAPGGALKRRLVMFMPSKVQDRFGNTVNYSYDGNGNLTGIQAGDGRQVTLNYFQWQAPTADTGPTLSPPTTYTSFRISSIVLQPASGAPRTWTYNYSSDPIVPRLTSVQQPDGSSWSFNMGGLPVSDLNADPGSQGTCSTTYTAAGAFGNATITHPSGLVGTFTAKPIIRGRSYVPEVCSSPFTIGLRPNTYTVSAIQQKVFSGAGIAVPLTWSYSYSPSNQSWNENCAGGSCTDSVTTDVVDPSGSDTHYVFSNHFDASEGQLRETDYHAQGSTSAVVRSETNFYANPVGGPWPMTLGSSRQAVVNAAQYTELSPLSVKTTHQDGDTYTWQAETFDNFAQPMTVKRFFSVDQCALEGPATVNGQCVEEHTTYVNDLPHWVLGLPAQLDNLTMGETVSHTDYDLSNVTPTARYSFGQKLMSYAFNAQGQLGSFTDGNSHTTTLSNYKRGIPQAIGHPDGHSQSLVVDDFGQISSITDQAGNTTNYSYDTIGRLSGITYPTGDTVAWAPKTFLYAFVGSERGVAGNHWHRIATQGTQGQFTEYDAMLRPILSESYRAADGALGTTTLTNYDWKGNKTFVSYPIAGSPAVGSTNPGVTTVYDALGRATSSQQPSELGTLTISTAYLSGARKQVTDSKAYFTTTAYQVFDQPSYDRVIEVLAPEGVTQIISRDIYGNPQSITQGGNGDVPITKTMIYDVNKRLCRTTEPESGSEVMAYDGANNLAWSASGLAITGAGCGQEQVAAAAMTTRSYDAMNRVLSVIYPTGTDSTTFTYDPLGNPATATSGLTSWTYGRNKLGLLTAEVLSVEGYQWSLGYGYDPGAHLSTIAYPDGKVVGYAPDALGRATQVGSYASGVNYFPDGDVQGFTFGSGATYVAGKNARNILSNFKYSKGSTDAVSEDLAYDANANITQITDLTNGLRSKVLSYDQLNRLTSATASNLWGTESYTYDTLNNIRSLTNSGGTNTYNYDTNNLLQTVTNGGTTVHAFQYDLRGNTINKNNVALTFDQANRLTAIQGKGTYLYDAAGRRVKKLQTGAAAATYYAYSQAGQLMFQYDPSTDMATDYLYLGKKLIASAENVVTPTAAPVLSGPASSQINTAYTLSWTSAPGATTYLLEEQVNGAAWVQVSNLGQLSQATQHGGAASYGYRVHACNASGCGPASNIVTVNVLPPPAAPNAPATITGTLAADRSSITVTWAASTGTTNYVVQKQVNGGVWQALYSGMALSTVLATPSDGTFAFQVQACSANGCSTWKGSSVVTVAHIPLTPASISVPATSTGQISVSWAASTYATSYTLQQSVNGGAWTTVFTNAANGTILNEGASASYTLRAQACNANGCSGFVTSPAVTVMLTPGAPGLSAPTSSNTGAYTVSWNLVANATSYNLQQQVNGGAWTTVQVNGGTSWATSGKGNGTYSYYVQACNALSCGPWSNILSVVVALIPAAPTNMYTVNAPPAGKGKVLATWNASAGATYYWVKVTGVGGAQVNLANVGNVTSVTYTFVTQFGATNTYTAQACNASGCSGWSNASSVVVQ